MSDTIVSRLTSQRTLLVDVIRQLDTAIAVFGGAPTNGNGNGHTTKIATPARKSRRHLTAEQWQSAREQYARGEVVVDIARRFRVSTPAIYGRAQREGWTCTHADVVG